MPAVCLMLSSPSAGKRSAAYLRPSAANTAAQCIRLRLCVAFAGGSTINGCFAPSSAVRALSDALHRHQRATVSRLSASVCGRIRRRVCRASGALHHQQQGNGQPPVCICLRANSAAVCVRHCWRNRATMIHENSIICNCICENSLIKKLLTFVWQ